jgi:glycosyltransferase 2 family protein
MRLGWRGLLGILLSVALLYWTLHDVPLGSVWKALLASNIPLLVFAAAIATLSFPIRAWRWRYILFPVAPSLSFGPLWRSTAIGMMVNNVVPARAGELARAYALSREPVQVGFAAALGSLVVDRVFDALVILLLLLAVVSIPSFPPGKLVINHPVEYWLRLAGAIAAVALGGIGLLAFLPRQVIGLWLRVTSRAAPRAAERGRDILNAFATGLAVIRDPMRFVIVFFWAVVGWIINGVSFWMALRALGITTPFASAFFLQSMLAIAVSVPSAPGFMGVFEAVSKASLSVYAVPDTLSVSFALGYHILSFIPITVIGLWYFVRLGMHFRELGTSGAQAATE